MQLKRLGKITAIFLTVLLAAGVFAGCAKEEPEVYSAALLPYEELKNEITIRPLIDPANEVRGVFIATVYNIDFPSKPDLSAEQLRAELDAILTNVESAGLNTIYFQVRPSCDALYKSDIFPVSASLSTTGTLVMDPLAYLVEEGHKRNIFVHAWVNPMRVTLGSASSPKTDVNQLPEGSPVRHHPDWVLPYADGKLYLNPGIPEVRKLISDGVREIVQNYNVDGVVFDDYFYPYPVKTSSGSIADVDDSESYKKYGGTLSLADWRRDNVNRMIQSVYETVKGVHEEILFGVNPFGIWQNDDGKNGGSATKGTESYSAIYCDPVAWAQGGYVDYIAPQLYWRFSTTAAPFGELVRFWNRMLDGTGVDLLIAHAAYQYDGWTDPQGEISQQIQFARSELTYRGSIFYGYEEIRDNTASLRDELKAMFRDSILYTDPSPTGQPPSVSSPAAGTYINAANTYLIGSSSPDSLLTVNGVKVSRTRGGYFSHYVKLAEGENVFVLEQNGVRVTHTLYRGTPPAKEPQTASLKMEDFSVLNVSPASDMLRDSGSSFTVSCNAPAGAVVKARLGDTEITLKQTQTVEKEEEGWTKASYSAVMKLPKAGNDEILDLGEIVVTAVSGENEASSSGASVRVRGKDAFIPVQVKNDHTELKLGLNSYYYDDFSVQSAGMTDRAVWQGNGFYLLRVGGYVYENSVTEMDAETQIPIGKLAGIRVYTEGAKTYISCGVDQNVPHNGTVRGGNFELTLYNVDVATVPKNISVENNPLIESVTVTYPNKANCVRLLCKLYDTENFYGFDFAYTDNGALTILPNPRKIDFTSDKPLSGLRIVLDAGHGGTDTGARGPLMNAGRSVCEKDLNLAITLETAEKLRVLGAEVILTRSTDTTVSLTERMDFLCDIMPDLSISIHQNSVDYNVNVGSVRGTLGLWWADSGILLTRCVSRKTAEALVRREMDFKQQKLALCRNPKFPSTLVEVGFITSVEEYEFMLNGGISRAAEGITEGVLEYFREQEKWIK